MVRRIVLASVTGILMVLAAWSLTSTCAQGAAPVGIPHPADAPAAVAGEILPRESAASTAVPTPTVDVTVVVYVTTTTSITPTVEETAEADVWAVADLTSTVSVTATPSAAPTLYLVGPNGQVLLSPAVYRMDVLQQEAVLYVRSTATSSISARLIEACSVAGEPIAAGLGISPASQAIAAGEVVTFTLSVADGALPLGAYTGTLELSDESTGVPVRQPLVLWVSPWSAELEWAQDEFVYEVAPQQSELCVRVLARRGQAEQARAELTTLRQSNAGITATFSTAGFLSIPPLETLGEGKVTTFTLYLTPTLLPAPGAYEGVLRLSAANAAPITAPFTLIIPESRARAGYQLVVAELGPSPAVTPALTLTTALQFNGLRWLPGSASAVDWWPVAAGALLLGFGLAALVGYAAWALVAQVRNVGDQSSKAHIRERIVSWIKSHPLLSLMMACGLFGVLVVCSVAVPLHLSQASVGERTLLIWEVEGRGPVREVTVVGGEVTNEIGNTGTIEIGEHGSEIAAGQALTVPVADVRDISRPGVYQGRILIQSPDTAAGVVEVPVQVTVHDFILWPGLAILLGVVLGGWVKYHQETASDRLAQRKALQEAWEEWNGYLGKDPRRETPAGRLNPLYARVRSRIDRAHQLLDLDPEWGVEEAKATVADVRRQLGDYQALNDRLTLLEVNLEALDVSAQGKAFSDTPDSFCDLRDHVGKESRALACDLCNGELSDAQRRWEREFVARSRLELEALERKFTEWETNNTKLLSARKNLNEAKTRLQNATQHPEEYVNAWLLLIRAQAEFEATIARAVADEVPAPMREQIEEELPAEVREWLTQLPVQGHLMLSRSGLGADALARWLVQRQAEERRMPRRPELSVEEPAPYLWKDANASGEFTCPLTFRVTGASSGLHLKVRPDTARVNDPTLDGAVWTYSVEFFQSPKTWRGEPVKYTVVVECGEEPPLEKTVTIVSPYAIELPFGKIVRGEWLFWEATFCGNDQRNHRSYECKLNDKQIGSGELRSGETPSDKHLVPPNLERKTARIQLLVYDNDRKLVQQVLREEPVQESATVGLYRDKRRSNFNRGLAALALALIGGVAANRVFHLTFGSFEEYLGALLWGVGVSTGIDPIADGYKNLKKEITNLLPKRKTEDKPDPLA